MIERTVFPGTVESLTFSFTTDFNLSNTTLFVVPELARFLALQPDSLGRIVRQHTRDIRASLAVPTSTVAGDYRGTVHLRSGKITFPDALEVVLHVIQPSANDIPTQITAPSLDRVAEYPTGERLVRDELVVMLDRDLTDPASVIRGIAAQTEGLIVGATPETLTYQLRYEVQDLTSLESIRDLVSSLPSVESASKNFLPVPDWPTPPTDDSRYTSPYSEDDPSGDNWGLEYIKAASAWDLVDDSSASRIPIGVVDWMFLADHEDLLGNVDPAARVPLIDCGASEVLSGFCDLGLYLRRAHGTHVAGTACAEGNNGRGVTGVTWKCSLKLYDLGLRATHLSTAWNMYQAVTRGNARVVNHSGGGHSKDLAALDETEAIYRRYMVDAEQAAGPSGVLWVFAAGNDSDELKYTVPARLAERPGFSSHTLAVTAIASASTPSRPILASFSNFESNPPPTGTDPIVAAPGEEILSTVYRSFLGEIIADYGTFSGTSQAAPHVAGLAALVLSKLPELTAAQVKSCIVSAAKAYGPKVAGHSFHVINAPEAVKCEGAGAGGFASTYAPPGGWAVGSGGRAIGSGGFVVSGTSMTGSPLVYRASVLRLNVAGGILWERAFGLSAKYVSGADIEATRDAGFVLVGSVSIQPQSGGQQGLIVKLDANGQPIWQRVVSATSTALQLSSIQQTRDGGYILGGHAADESTRQSLGSVVVKLSATGDIEWQRIIRSSDIRSVRETSTGYLVAGTTDSIPQTLAMVTLDAHGVVTGQRRYAGSDGHLWASDATPTQDGGAVFAGLAVVKVNAAGSVEWAKRYAGFITSAIRQASDGGYILGVSPLGATSSNAGIARLGADGEILWASGFASPQTSAKAVAQTATGGYATFGAAATNNFVFVLNTDANGRIAGCSPLYAVSRAQLPGAVSEVVPVTPVDDFNGRVESISLSSLSVGVARQTHCSSP
jgi:subtilisin family serine protease